MQPSFLQCWLIALRLKKPVAKPPQQHRPAYAGHVPPRPVPAPAVASSPTITITRPALAPALLAWELAYRNGETRTTAESLALPVAQVADESARYLWDLLAPLTPAQPAPEVW